MLSDLRFAFRQLVKSPGYACVVVLTLALGIAVNTNLFAMLNMFFLQKLPTPVADRLVLVLQKNETWPMPHGLSFPDFKDYRERMKSVSDLFISQPAPAHLSATGHSPERAWIEVVTPNAFAALQLHPHLGRLLLPSDGEARGGAAIAVLSYDCWQQRFGGDPAILQRVVQINGQPFTVVGVAAPGFHSFAAMLGVHAWVPTSALDSFRPKGGDQLEWRSAGGWRVTGVLRAGFTLADVRAEAATILANLTTEYPDSHHAAVSVVIPESRARPDPIFADYVPVFTALFVGLVLLVLVIACANVANLMFARAAQRQRELTVRASLGASRGRLVRQLLIESWLLAALAGVVGWVLSVWTGELMRTFSPQGDMPIVLNTETHWHNHAFVIGISFLAGFVSGILPALRASQIDLVQHLKEGAGGRLVVSRHWMRNVLVVSQVMFSLVVLICAGLFLRSLGKLRNVDLGFDSHGLLLTSFDTGLQGYREKQSRNFNAQLLERVRALPGVKSAMLTANVPFDYQVSQRQVLPENPPEGMQDGSTTSTLFTVSPGYIEMMGYRLRKGRTLAESDDERATRVAVVNVTFAERCWPGQDPLGKRFRPWKDGPWIEIVGLTENAKYVMLSEPPRPVMFCSLLQEVHTPASLVIRTNGDPIAVGPAVRGVVHSLDPHLPVYGVRTMDDLLAGSAFAFMPLRMGATLASVQGLIGLFLSVMGLYSVVSFGVTQRTREIGIRIALGAQPSSVVLEVLREGARLTAIGIAAGLVLAATVTFVLSKSMYGVTGFDALTFAVFTLLLIAIAAFACWWPARRAARVDPMVALRTE